MLTEREIITAINLKRFPLGDEKQLQSQLAFHMKPLNLEREYKLDDKNVVDFFKDGIAIEVKIKGNKMDIYRQIERYALFDEVKSIILVTNRAMGFPESINNKPIFVVNLGKAWL